MTTTTELTIYRNDTPTLVFTLKKPDGTAFDLTNATAVYFTAKSKLNLPDARAAINRACTIDTPLTGGICRVALTAADTANAGKFTAEIEVTLTGPKTITASQFELTIATDVRRGS